MGDPNLNGAQENLFGNYIIQKGLSNPELRDEILVQVANQVSLLHMPMEENFFKITNLTLFHNNVFAHHFCQVWRNPNILNSERGWLLLSSCLSAFLPSQRMAKFLLK